MSAPTPRRPRRTRPAAAPGAEGGAPAPRRGGPGDPRRLRPPAPPLTEPFEGAEILDERDDELGGLLWNSLRTVTVWARTPAERRAASAAPAAAARRREDLDEVAPPEPLRAPLERVAALLERPGDAHAAEVGAACRAVAEWAASAGMTVTAAEFYGAGALAHPADATLATAAGRMLRRLGRYPRAEGWLRHAMVLARAAGDRAAYALARTSLGNLFMERGAFPRARQHLAEALAFARRHALRQVEPLVLQDLFAVAAAAGRPAEAERYAGEALAAYAPGHPNLAFLAADMGFFWVERGHFAEARRVLLQLRERIGEPYRLFLLNSALARAAGGLGDERLFLEARARVLEHVAADRDADDAAAALANVAQGALSLGMLEMAEAAAAEAERVAEERGEGRMRLVVESLRERIARGVVAPAARTNPAPRRSLLAERVVERLATVG